MNIGLLGSWTCHDLSEKMCAMALDHDTWQRLGEYVTRRRTELGMTQGQVQAAGGPSVATMRLIEGAMQRNYRAHILGGLEQALRWEPGSISRILDGGEPTPVTTQPDANSDRYVDAEAELRAIRDNANRAPHLRAWAQSQLDQIVAIREAVRAEDNRNVS
ncbi:hypothetical protein [Micromonospora profundi]|uniref:hypothetical protein n=1 Tax=Micromonospora profundi TaxID=1420889 RepID=UPI003647B1C4